jgi:hypothetical protein
MCEGSNRDIWPTSDGVLAKSKMLDPEVPLKFTMNHFRTGGCPGFPSDVEDQQMLGVVVVSAA